MHTNPILSPTPRLSYLYDAKTEEEHKHQQDPLAKSLKNLDRVMSNPDPLHIMPTLNQLLIDSRDLLQDLLNSRTKNALTTISPYIPHTLTTPIRFLQPHFVPWPQKQNF